MLLEYESCTKSDDYMVSPVVGAAGGEAFQFVCLCNPLPFSLSNDARFVLDAKPTGRSLRCC